MSKNKNPAGIKRRLVESDDIQSLAEDVHGKVNETIDVAADGLRRQQQIKDAEARVRAKDARRAGALENPRAVRS